MIWSLPNLGPILLEMILELGLGSNFFFEELFTCNVFSDRCFVQLVIWTIQILPRMDFSVTIRIDFFMLIQVEQVSCFILFPYFRSLIS